MKGLGALLLFFCLWPLMAGAYLYDIKALRKWSPEYNRYHYFIGCCDFHDKMHQANPVQRKRIEELLLSYDPATILVLAEDLSSANDAGRMGCGAYYINSRVGVLAGLSNYCKKCYIPVHNVEYRYCRVVALGPVINNISADPHMFPSAHMGLPQLLSEIDQVYNELLMSSATGIFKDHFVKHSQTIRQAMQKLNIADNNQSIADYLANASSPLNRFELVKHLLTFDGILIGFKLVDSTIKATAKEKIIAFAGGTHINEAYELLQKIDNWEPVTHGELSTIKNSVARGINTPINDKGMRGKPQPISLQLLEHYLRN